MIQGEDVSHYQPLTRVDPSVRFAWCKSSEGAGTRDVSYNHHRAMYRAAGVPAGPYHFLRPVGSAADQARFWRHEAGPSEPGDLRPAADIEVPGLSVAWLRGFLEEAERQFGCRPIIYASLGYLPNLAGLEDFDLWVAAYRATEPRPAGWRTVCWQNSDRGPDGGDSDLTHDLTALLVAGVAPPQPAQPQPTTHPEDHVRRIPLHISLDKDGNGYNDVPGIAADHVISVAVNAADPKTGGYPDHGIDVSWCQIDAVVRVEAVDGPPAGAVDVGVWVADD